MARHKTAADEEHFSLRYEEQRRPLISPWNATAIILLLCVIAGVLMRVFLLER